MDNLLCVRLEEGLMEQKRPQVSLDKLDDSNYVVVEMISSPAYPNFVGTY
jgi:hypothetical protein